MYLLSNLLSAIAYIVHTVIWLYTWVIIIAALLSWVNPDPYNPIVRTLKGLTDPVLWRVRKHMPFTYVGGLDLSPVVVIFALQFFDLVIVRSLDQFSARLLMSSSTGLG